MYKKMTILMVVVVFLSGHLVACGGSGEPKPVSEEQEPEPTVSPVSSIDDVQKATVRIIVEGAIALPDGTTFVEGSGSGFIIDPSGLAVTNNHVVTGASTVSVYIDGEDEPRSANILGVSECSDLAVIDIEGDDFSFVGWFEEEIKVGLEVYAAGFPLGDPEYTLTDGIVAKASSSSAAAHSGVEKAIEHTANLQHGNSGGPLVDGNGKVVGVNFYGMTISEVDQTQFFAISRDEAKPITDVLKTDEDKFAIGINGEPIALDDESPAIWIYGVKTGSPADKTRIRAGDAIISLEGIPMGANRSMNDYCEILRSHDPEDSLKVVVYRDSTGQFLEGEINGRELTVISEAVNPPPPPPGGGDQVISGALISSDYISDADAYYDVYSFEANTGDQVIIILESNDFDAYLGVFGVNGELLAQDDDSGGGGNSYVSLAIPETGTYTIIATSYGPGELGAYTLTIDFY